MSSNTPPSRTRAPARLLQVVVVAVGEDEYALPIERVQEVVHYTRPRPVPRADPLVRGVIDLRGRVIPVLSARGSFGLSDAELPDDAKIAVLRLEDDTRVGLIVDDVVEVLTVDAAKTVPPPERAGVAAVEAIDAVIRLEDRLLVILDVEALIDPARQGIAVNMAVLAPLIAETPPPPAEAEPEPELEPEPPVAITPEPEPEPVPEPPAPVVEAAAETPAPADGRSGFSEADIAAVRTVFALVEQHEQQAFGLFSTRLGEVDPGLRLRLRLEDPTQGRRFMAALRLSVRGLDRLDELLPALAALGVRVDPAAITPADCRTAIDAFLWTLQRGLGTRFDPASRKACGTTAWTLLGILAKR